MPAAPTTFIDESGRGISVIDLPARKTRGVKGTIVYQLPMGNPLDHNYRYHLAVLASAHPDYRMIAFGNPSAKPYYLKQHNLSVWASLRVLLGDVKPLLQAEASYLRRQGIQQATMLGFSYGAVKTLWHAEQLPADTLKNIIVIDPPSHARAPWELLEHFRATFTPMGEYINRTKLPTFFQARAEADKTGHIGPGLRRPINVLIGLLVARFDVGRAMRRVFRHTPTMPVTLVWGTRSELVAHDHVTTVVQKLQGDALPVTPIVLPGHHHAFANDVILMDAILRQSLLPQQGS